MVRSPMVTYRTLSALLGFLVWPVPSDAALGQPVAGPPTAKSPAVSAAQAIAASSRPDGRRMRTDSVWQSAWMRGDSSDVDVVGRVSSIVAVGGSVIALDDGMREVYRLDIRTGATQSILKSRGSGPGEFRAPRRVIGNGSTYAIVDGGNGRLTRFDARHQLLSEVSIESAGIVQGGCLYADGGTMLKLALGANNSLAVLSPRGRVERLVRLPVRDTTLPSSAYSAHLAGPFPDGSCAIVPSFGAVWYLIDRSGRVRTHRYQEPGDAPVVTQTQEVLEKGVGKELVAVTQTFNTDPIARLAVARGDTLIVSAGKTKLQPNRLLDYYSVSTGAYLFTRKSRGAPFALASAPNDRFVQVTPSRDYAYVEVIRVAPTAAAPPANGRPIATFVPIRPPSAPPPTAGTPARPRQPARGRR